MKLVTIPNVEIAKVGTFPLSTGEHTFTKAQLASALAKANRPRIGIGHVDERFNASAQDGDPALGQVEFTGLSEDGETLLGQYVNVPEWFAKAMPAAYPARSIEGSCDGDDLTIDAVKVLGMTKPGISTLEDIKQVFSEDGPPIAIAAGEDANGKKFTAIIDFTGSGRLEASAPEERGDNNDPEGGSHMDPEKIRELLGLEKDASDEDVEAKIKELGERVSPEQFDEKVSEKVDEVVEEKVAAARADERKKVQASKLPEGVVAIEAAALDDLKTQAQAGAEARLRQLADEREAVVDDAVRKGRIAASRKQHWIDQLKADPGAKDILASLAEGTIPVDERGRNDNPEDQVGAQQGTGLLPELAQKGD